MNPPLTCPRRPWRLLPCELQVYTTRCEQSIPGSKMMQAKGYHKKYHRLVGMSRDTNQVDAIARSVSVGQVMSQMCSIHTDTFSIFQASHKFPVDFLVTKGRPTMSTTFHQKVFHGATTRSKKEWPSGIGIIKGYFATLSSRPRLLKELGCFKVTAVLCVVTVKVADMKKNDALFISKRRMQRVTLAIRHATATTTTYQIRSAVA